MAPSFIIHILISAADSTGFLTSTLSGQISTNKYSNLISISYFRSARFNTSPLHYLRAWHRLCQPRWAETRTALNFAFINTESKIEVFHGKNWKNTLSAVIGDLNLYNAWYKKRKNVKQKNVKQPIVIRFYCSSVLSHLDGDQINIFVKAYAFPNKLNYKKENTNTALTRCQIQ